MNADLVSRVRDNPKFAELERKRSAFSRQLAILMLVIYCGFIYAVAFTRSRCWPSRSARSPRSASRSASA